MCAKSCQCSDLVLWLLCCWECMHTLGSSLGGNERAVATITNILSSKGHSWVMETVLPGEPRGVGCSCSVSSGWTHGHSAVGRDQGSLSRAYSTLVHLCCVLLVSLSLHCIPSPPISFSCWFPFVTLQSLLSPLMSLYLKRASHPGYHMISRKPYRHLAFCIV